MPTLIKKQFEFVIKEVKQEEYIIRAVISSGQPDRHGEIVDQSSWNLEEYKKNPVVLWSHDHYQPAIGMATEIGINNEGMLEAVVKFAVDQYDFAKTIFNLYAGGFMRAFSVGFMSENQEEANGFRILKQNTLFEFSAVNIGADALALAKQKGIDVSFFDKPEIVEKAGRVLSAKNRASVEAAHAALSEVLTADQEKDTKSAKVENMKFNYKKMAHKAVRELLKID
jgi:hypothetical protein